MEYILKRLKEIPEDKKVIIFTQNDDAMRRMLDNFDETDIPFVEFHSHMVRHATVAPIANYCDRF